MNKHGILFISLFIFIINTFAAKIDTIYVQSKCMNKSIPILLLYPIPIQSKKMVMLFFICFMVPVMIVENG